MAYLSGSSVQVWRLCLEMVALGDFNDAAYVRQLWDVHLNSRCARLRFGPSCRRDELQDGLFAAFYIGATSVRGVFLQGPHGPWRLLATKDVV